MTNLPGIVANDGDLVLATDMKAALTAAELVYEDGSTQTFNADGSTTFIENGRPSPGEWATEGDGRFSSFWPPSYRATYDIRWTVERGRLVGLTFVSDNGESFSGRYR
jgi:hypothetical protein